LNRYGYNPVVILQWDPIVQTPRTANMMAACAGIIKSVNIQYVFARKITM